MHQPRDLDTLVFVQLVFEHGTDVAAAVEHEVLPHQATGIGQSIRESGVGGVQQQTRGLRSISGQDYRLRLLKMLVFVVVEIGDAGGAPLLVRADLEHVAPGSDLAAPCRFRLRNHRDEGGRLRHHLATEPDAKTAVHAGRSPAKRHGRDGHRRRKRVQSQFAGTSL